MRYLAAFLVISACAPDELIPPEEPPAEEAAPPTLEPQRIEGLSIVKQKSGGHAKREHLGVLGSESFGVGGIGSMGFGAGGGGYGAGGLGMSGTRGGATMTEGEADSSSRNDFVERSPFAYAELRLPYRGGKIALFEPRSDARINDVVDARGDMLSTFAIDVDTAAYSIARRSIAAGHAPEPALVRVEEFVNYFHYDYAPPNAERELFTIEADGTRSPLAGNEHILRIGLQARIVRDADRLPASLVFLVDTSCSMTSDDKLGLAKKSLAIAVDHLHPDDRVAITTYAGGVSLVLPPTRVADKDTILAALAHLQSGGGTAMSSGLALAYQQAEKMLAPGHITRVIVCSDGDANIGNTTPEKMLEEIAGAVSEGVTMSTIGFGDGNYKDAMMETIADKGNGNYYYVDDLAQAERVFGRDLTKMLQDVAQDVKIQVAFDPRAVAKYRLIGYENRDIADKDFRNDRVDAGEIGAGHQVTALYAIEMQPLARGRLATVFVRAKKPRGMTAKESALEIPVGLVDQPYESVAGDLQFAIAVMGAAEIFRHSPHASAWKLEKIATIARDAGASNASERSEFIGLIERAARL